MIGEGEITIVELLEALERKKDLSSVSGIAFLENGNCIQTPRRALIHDIDNISFPAWELFPMEHYALLREANIKNSERCMLVLSGRGCAFGCNFCYRMDDGHRSRSSEGIIEEIQILQKDYAIKHRMKFILEFLTGTYEEKAARSGEKLRSVQKGNSSRPTGFLPLPFCTL